MSRFARAETVTIAFPGDGAGINSGPGSGPDVSLSGTTYRSLNLSVESNPRQVQRGRELAERAADMAMFYESLVGDSPYSSFTVALIGRDLPGGHSPGYFAALNQQLPSSQLVWRNDPAAFSGYPDFFLAHELAHQWWGQAVGWRNYHEQWISEGFAQYFAAMYAQRLRGDEVFVSVRRWGRRPASRSSASSRGGFTARRCRRSRWAIASRGPTSCFTSSRSARCSTCPSPSRSSMPIGNRST